MKEFETEIPKHLESSAERLNNRVAKLLKDIDNEIAVEVYGHGIGRQDEDSITNEQLQAEAKERFANLHDDFAGLFEGTSILAEALQIYGKYAREELSVEEAQIALEELVFSSAEHIKEIREKEQAVAEEFKAAEAKLPDFLDNKILQNQGDRAVMSRWGNAKLAYENGDPALLRSVLNDYVKTAIDDERELVEQFLRFLESKHSSDQ